MNIESIGASVINEEWNGEKEHRERLLSRHMEQPSRSKSVHTESRKQA